LALVVLLPAVLVPAVVIPPAGAVLAVLAASAAAAAYRYGPALEVRRRLGRRRRTAAGCAAGTVERHDAALAHWRRYELDLALLIDYPAMSDVGRSATAALVREMRQTEQARASAGDRGGGFRGHGFREGPGGGSLDDGGLAATRDYDRAVRRLELLLGEAERAAGVPAAERWAPTVTGRPGTVSARAQAPWPAAAGAGAGG
ncbi:MAG: hypothetical protein ACHP7K_02880, partial [Actinomycetales bacterium]